MPHAGKMKSEWTAERSGASLAGTLGTTRCSGDQTVLMAATDRMALTKNLCFIFICMSLPVRHVEQTAIPYPSWAVMDVCRM